MVGMFRVAQGIIMEKGIAASFEYNGVSDKLLEYLQSKAYNRVGTSVAFDHTVEAKAYTINYYDAYTKQNKTTTYEYPKNTIYKNGQYNNDGLTKIITQKFIAQVLVCLWKCGLITVV